MYPILKDRQVPAKAPTGPKISYPFKDMKAGDAFFIPLNDRLRRTVQASVSAFTKKTGVLFTTRAGVEDGVEGTFVFCVGPKEDRAAPRLVAGGAR